MKVAFCSDLHLEMTAVNFDFPEADVLLLAGDICIVYDLRESFCGTLTGQRYREFFKTVSKKYKNVIYTPGNHDHWGTAYFDIVNIFYMFCAEEGINNITFNYKGVLEVDDVRFVYATLWTDFNNKNPLCMEYARSYMNDYQYIEVRDGSFRQLTPDDVYTVHRNHRDHIAQYAQNHPKVVVMTHHAPNMMSLYDSTARSAVLYACKDMDDIILDNPQIKYYIHGHTHEEVDYLIGTTRVMTNCRGYYLNDFEVKVFSV